MDNQIEWKVRGMTCTNCAMSVDKQLKSLGLQGVEVDFMQSVVRFQHTTNDHIPLQKIQDGIQGLGFKVENAGSNTAAAKESLTEKLLGTPFKRFIACLIFTIPLWLHMVVQLPILHQPLFQLILATIVLVIGLVYLGRSAWHSLKSKVANMNVLVILGALAAFGYSLYGTLTGEPEAFLFYETSATIITLVFMGNWLESRTVAKTQASIKSLMLQQTVQANMLTYAADGSEIVFQVLSEDLKVGDLILIKSGELVPMDAKILSGEGDVDESILTGESLPVHKGKGELLIGNSQLVSGNLKAYISATGKDTVLQHMLRLVEKAQHQKAPMQLLADKISAVFVPVVLGLAALGFLLNYFIADAGFTSSLMRAIAMLVIACPCAMGLATPAGIAVGLGRATKKGILFKNAHALENFQKIKNIVFDKTGTLTTGKLQVDDFNHTSTISESAFKQILFNLEKYASHPLATAIMQAFKPTSKPHPANGANAPTQISFAKVEEIKGEGMRGTTKDGVQYMAVSARKAKAILAAANIDKAADSQNDPIQLIEPHHHIYLLRETEILGWVSFKDTIRPEALPTIQTLKNAGFTTYMISGDSEINCQTVAEQLGIDHVYSEQSPEQKQMAVRKIKEEAPVAMIGDGINDSPALAEATVGVSLGNATQIAIMTADVLLIRNGIGSLPLALGLGKHTYSTIRQNLIWAFAYNVVALPIAGLGLLSPSFAALAMGLSDVVLGFNSIRLSWKKVC
ncbi:heavy metal translocating P-type ATPase [Arachidicoccus ginsenosidivorans]|uniref:Cation-translocating P-type ATPase n=1 Tax=Arachidicoccus ginsenosidivorans TaxID=496057 RepID=A0A5B8VL61_9BACT|nr:cation-translocating P-type ATPase [Arachidicoccus ginsenosidivorans]QEC71695.1 cation-translocating P-type ATPase [Arachidicoccus ginsenosidivorans]